MPDETTQRWPTGAVFAVVATVLVLMLAAVMAFSSDDAERPMSEDGTYRIDDCLGCTSRPGTYETQVPLESKGCAWMRRTDLTGNLASLVDSGVAQPGRIVRVVVRSGEHFTTKGCGDWRCVG